MEIKSKSCCFTGHRHISRRKIGLIRQKLKNTIVEAVKGGYDTFYAGGAVGFDTIAAQLVLELKEKYPEIKLKLALPCKSQTDDWEKDDIDQYIKIKDLADEVIYTSEENKKGCMHKRNRYLVDNSSLCIRHMTKKSGGTAYTVNYAKKENFCYKYQRNSIEINDFSISIKINLFLN